MVSTERVYEYSKLKPEPDDGKMYENHPKQWPQHGLICTQNASFAYHSTLPNVLSELNFIIKPGEKVDRNLDADSEQNMWRRVFYNISQSIK